MDIVLIQKVVPEVSCPGLGYPLTKQLGRWFALTNIAWHVIMNTIKEFKREKSASPAGLTVRGKSNAVPTSGLSMAFNKLHTTKQEKRGNGPSQTGVISGPSQTGANRFAIFEEEDEGAVACTLHDEEQIIDSFVFGYAGRWFSTSGDDAYVNANGKWYSKHEQLNDQTGDFVCHPQEKGERKQKQGIKKPPIERGYCQLVTTTNVDESVSYAIGGGTDLRAFDMDGFWRKVRCTFCHSRNVVVTIYEIPCLGSCKRCWRGFDMQIEKFLAPPHAPVSQINGNNGEATNTDDLVAPRRANLNNRGAGRHGGPPGPPVPMHPIQPQAGIPLNPANWVNPIVDVANWNAKDLGVVAGAVKTVSDKNRDVAKLPGELQQQAIDNGTKTEQLHILNQTSGSIIAKSAAEADKMRAEEQLLQSQIQRTNAEIGRVHADALFLNNGARRELSIADRANAEALLHVATANKLNEERFTIELNNQLLQRTVDEQLRPVPLPPYTRSMAPIWIRGQRTWMEWAGCCVQRNGTIAMRPPAGLGQNLQLLIADNYIMPLSEYERDEESVRLYGAWDDFLHLNGYHKSLYYAYLRENGYYNYNHVHVYQELLDEVLKNTAGATPTAQLHNTLLDRFVSRNKTPGMDLNVAENSVTVAFQLLHMKAWLRNRGIMPLNY
jgi:hypothetical protein